MPGLSVEELRKLARGFLTGQAEPRELESMKKILGEDLQMGLELLTQMQTALDETAPARLAPDQWKTVDEKVAALFEPHTSAKRGFSFVGWLKKLFGKKKSASVRVKGRRGEVESAEEDVLPMPEVESAPGIEADDMAPIAPENPEASRENSEIDSDDMAPISDSDDITAAVDGALDKKDSKKNKIKFSLPAGAEKALKFMALVLVLAALLWAIWIYWLAGVFADKPVKTEKSRPAPVKAAVKPTEIPTRVPTPGPQAPRRAVFVPDWSQADEILPAEVAPTTPVAAGWTEPLGGYEALDEDGDGRLPLPTQ